MENKNPHKDMILMKVWLTKEEVEELAELRPWGIDKSRIAEIIIKANERGDFFK